MSNDEMTIDERLKFLLTSTESLHASVQELSATQARQIEEHDKRYQEQQQENAKQRQHQRAMLAAIRAYLEGLENGEGR